MMVRQHQTWPRKDTDRYAVLLLLALWLWRSACFAPPSIALHLSCTADDLVLVRWSSYLFRLVVLARWFWSARIFRCDTRICRSDIIMSFRTRSGGYGSRIGGSARSARASTNVTATQHHDAPATGVLSRGVCPPSGGCLPTDVSPVYFVALLWHWACASTSKSLPSSVKDRTASS